MSQITMQQSGQGVFSLAPRSLDDAFRLADIMASSEMVPKDFRGKPGNVLVAVQMGAEVGLQPMQALQNIAVINGRPSIWGDAVKAIILNSSLCEKFEETFDESSMTAWVRVKRKGHSEHEVSFSAEDAKKAQLWGKQGPWQQYPKRMLQMRARSFAARDEFADVLKGLSVAEEQRDISEKDAVLEHDITPIHYAEPKVEARTALEYYPAHKFARKLDEWQEQIKSGSRTADDVINTLLSRYALSDEQIQSLKSCEVSA